MDLKSANEAEVCCARFIIYIYYICLKLMHLQIQCTP